MMQDHIRTLRALRVSFEHEGDEAATRDPEDAAMLYRMARGYQTAADMLADEERTLTANSRDTGGTSHE